MLCSKNINFQVKIISHGRCPYYSTFTYSSIFSFYTITTVQFDETFITLALRCVLINLSAVFLTDSFFIPLLPPSPRFIA